VNPPIVLKVVGIPETQGSKSAFVVKGTNRAVITEGRGTSSPKARRHKEWRSAVADAARDWQEEHGRGQLTGPVVVQMEFSLLRPQSAPKTRRTWPVGARSGDVDLLARACLDSLTGIVFADDAAVVLLLVGKDYGDPPGVVVRVWELPEGANGVLASWTVG
jgi:crossover junction endodeoxyribonuclease RusA